MATSSMATDMARLDVCPTRTLAARHRADKAALPSSSSTSCTPCGRLLFEALTFPRATRHITSACKRICSTSVLALTPDYFHIPYTEGVPVGSKLKLFNLPYNCDHGSLVEHFQTCGAFVESLEIANNSEEDGNASGFVVLGDLDQACAAVAQLDGARFQGKCVRMDFVERRPYENRNPNRSSLKSRRRNRPPPVQVANRVYIGNLPWRVDSTTLEQLFSVHGTVQEAEVMRDRINGRSRGYGFVGMSSAAEMEKAIAALDGCEIEGRSLRVAVATVRAVGSAQD